MTSRARPRGWLYAAAWTPYLGIYLTAFVANGLPLGLAVRNAVASTLPAILLGLLVLRLPARLPPPPAVSRPRFLALQAALLLAFILASTVSWAILVALDASVFGGSFRASVDPRLLPWRVLNDLLIYCTLSGLAYAWHGASRARELAERAARAEALRARAELEALRSQLNPHFLFNTFHALLGLVRREPQVAEEAMERLGDLLRYSLRVQREALDEVTLREEWAFVGTYVELERLRLGDRLSTSLEAAPLALECAVPSFALQTLVENAIRHGIAPRALGGRLAVRAVQVDGRLRIQVEDEAPGGAAANPAEEGQGMGLRLLKERLAALYPGQASLTLSAAGSGMCAVLDLPARHPLEAR